MFQNNLLLTQLKKQLRFKTPRVEGIVKGTEKGFGFLEVDTFKSYFIPPCFMKKVMHGDRVIAIVHTERDREIVEPEKLIEPFLTRFVGRIRVNKNHITVMPRHPLIKENVQTRIQCGINQNFRTGDWVVARMLHHPLKGDRQFYAEIIALVATASDHFAPWWVTLASHNLERTAPEIPKNIILKENEEKSIRKDLTKLDFITIDNASTEDIDDAIHLSTAPNGDWIITIAIADPTAWITSGSDLDCIASSRAFTSYLPGFNIPMLPRALSDDICSLRAYKRRPALACQVTIYKNGALANDAHFFTAWIESKAKLTYNLVSDWIENIGNWKPENNAIVNQIRMLHEVYLARSAWRKNNALLFKERPEYKFILDEKGNVDNIVIEPRRIANRMIEEAMIAANICAARVLRDNLGYGLYNVHHGFDPLLVDQAANVLREHHINIQPNELLTLEGFCNMKRKLDALPTTYLSRRIRRFQTFAEVSTMPGPHFGLGLDIYATWTSPIRKYSDMLNHRLLKSIIGVGKAERPNKEMTLRLTERRRQNRIAEREVGDWLYAKFLQPQVGNNYRFSAEITGISRGGMRVCLLENGAKAFIPAAFMHNVRDELICNQDIGIVQINGRERYRQGDILDVILYEVRVESCFVIVKPA